MVATLKQLLARLGSGIESTPGVCGGEPCMTGTLVPTAGPPPATAPGIWAKLAELGCWAESRPSGLPNDLAENHDHYLHGRPIDSRTA